MSNLFNVGDKVVYPSHGVGEIVSLESQIIANSEIKVYVISFPQDKMVLRVPVSRASHSGLRPIVSIEVIEQIYEVLKGRAKPGNKMWSRRAQEYETKINSGDILQIAEVVRDLYKNVDSNRSYSERNIYELALNRLAKEISILQNSSPEQEIDKLVEFLRERHAA